MAKHNDRKERHRAEKEAKRGKEFQAHHRFARIAGTKVRLVADQVRGLPISRALETLKFSKKRGGMMLNKVLKSALANAEYQISEHKLDLDVDDLFVATVMVDEGPTLKRWMTRSRGMAYPILRRYCHIHAMLAPKGAEKGEGEKPAAAEAKAPKAEKKSKKAEGGKAQGAKKTAKKATAGAK